MALTSAAAPGTALEFLTQQGAYSANVSTLGAGRPYAVHVTLDIEGTDFGDAADISITANDCHVSDIGLSEGQPSTLSFSAEVLGAISGDVAASGDLIHGRCPAPTPRASTQRTPPRRRAPAGHREGPAGAARHLPRR